MRQFPDLQVKVWGDYACFTRPEMKVERVSYPIMTPSAARGVLEAIFWKPEFSWRVTEVAVLNPIQYYSIVRNEVQSKASVKAVLGRLKKGEGYYAEDDRTQRHSLILRDVAYVITARMHLREHATDPEPKYRDQFRRKVERGACHFPPYLGNREFTAWFAPPDNGQQPIPVTEDLGNMLFDIRYEGGGSGRGRPVFFKAKLENGVLRVPQERYKEVEGNAA